MSVSHSLPDNSHLSTLLVHGGGLRSQHLETSEAVYMTSGYVYQSAEEAESAFANDGSRYVYSRYANPTVSMFEERLRLIEGAEACRSKLYSDLAVNIFIREEADEGHSVLGPPGQSLCAASSSSAGMGSDAAGSPPPWANRVHTS